MRILDQTVRLRSGSGTVPAQIFGRILTIRAEIFYGSRHMPGYYLKHVTTCTFHIHTDFWFTFVVAGCDDVRSLAAQLNKLLIRMLHVYRS